LKTQITENLLGYIAKIVVALFQRESSVEGTSLGVGGGGGGGVFFFILFIVRNISW